MNKDQKNLWERVLNGAADIDSAEVKIMESESEEFSRKVSGLREVQAELEGAALQMQEVIKEARDAPVLDSDLNLLDHIPAESEASAGLTPVGSGSGSGSSSGSSSAQSSPFGAKIWKLAAAVFLMAASWSLYQQFGQGVRTDPGPMMGQEGAPLPTYPLAGDAKLDRFEWQGKLEFGSWFRVLVVDLDSDQTIQSPKLNSNQWIPNEPIPYQRASWSVVLYHGSGAAPVSSSSVEVSL